MERKPVDSDRYGDEQSIPHLFISLRRLSLFQEQAIAKRRKDTYSVKIAKLQGVKSPWREATRLVARVASEVPVLGVEWREQPGVRRREHDEMASGGQPTIGLAKLAGIVLNVLENVNVEDGVEALGGRDVVRVPRTTLQVFGSSRRKIIFWRWLVCVASGSRQTHVSDPECARSLVVPPMPAPTSSTLPRTNARNSAAT